MPNRSAQQGAHLLNSCWDGHCRSHAHDGRVHSHSREAPEDAQHWQAPAQGLTPSHEQHCCSTVRDLYMEDSIIVAWIIWTLSGRGMLLVCLFANEVMHSGRSMRSEEKHAATVCTCTITAAAPRCCVAGKAPAPCSYNVTLTDHSAYLAAVSCCCGAVPLEDCLEPRQAGCCGAWPDAVIC